MSTFLALATLSLVVSSQAAGLSSVAPNVVATTAPAVVATVAPVVSTITPAPTATAQAAGSTPSPLTEYLYPYAAIPYQVNPYAYLRGPQSGFNQCNSTTEGVSSRCQTAILNSLSDFCLWGAPGLAANQSIGDVEAAVVSYCTGTGHGGRIMPAGTITGAQFMRTSKYIQVVGTLNQTGVNLLSADTGGELDPHGADNLGNPLGGLVYSNNLVANGTTYSQASSWNNFIGSGIFCFKLCLDNSYPNYCQNVYDLIGCNYNAPAAYTKGSFISCDGDLQDPAGTYTISGVAYTWSQPSLLPATSTLPWTPRIPASSNCVTHQSTELYPVASLGYQMAAALATASTSTTSSAKTSTAVVTKTGTATGTAVTTTPTPSSAASVGAKALSGSLFLVGLLVAAL